MPLPEPRAGESRDDWMARCMADDAMQNEFPDAGQRTAVCADKWDSRQARRVRQRSSLATGLQDGPAGVDRAARTIRGYSVVTRGEAVTWDQWLDEEFLDQVVAAGNAMPSGLKSRFTHPGLCSDGLGKFLGRTRNLRRIGDRVIADLHLAEVGSTTPEGDLAGYVMDLAEEDPEAFGASIVYWRDYGAEDRFIATHEGESGGFVSPDPENTNNYPHVRLAQLTAADVVDEPAANSGFFTRLEQGTLVEQADRWADWALGLSTAPPDDVALGLGIESERAREWLHGYLARRGMKIVRKEQDGIGPSEQSSGPPNEEKVMPDEQKEAAEKQAAALREEGQEAERARFARLKEKFGDRPGFVIEQFTAGHDVPEADAALKDVLLAEREAEIAELKTKAAEKPATPGTGPVEHVAGPEESPAPDFYRLVDEYQASHPGTSRGDAMVEMSKRHPKLADKVCMPTGVSQLR